MLLSLLLTLWPQAQTPELPPQREADTLPQEAGVYGTLRPQVRDIVLPDELVHTDRDGRAAHQLLDLAGSEQHGFAAVWRDSRDGNAGLYFGRLGTTGQALEPERALYPTGSTSRELEPAIAISPRGNGAFVWFSSGGSVQSLKLRSFDAEGRLAPQATPLENPRGLADGSGRSSALGESVQGDGRRGGGGVRLAAIALAESFGAVGWGNNGTLWVRRFDAVGALLGAAVKLSTPERTLAGPLRLCAGRSKSSAAIDAIGCAWTTHEGVEFTLIGETESARRFLGAGALERLVGAPANASGWWALVQTNAGHKLICVPAVLNGAGGSNPIMIDLGVSPREACDVAVRANSFLISVQRASGVVELFTLDPNAADPRAKLLVSLDAAGTVATDVRIAGCGERALVAWTGTNARQSDVWLRAIAADGALCAAQRWNSDEASSAQTQGRIAARGGDRAALAWLDARSGETQLMARWLGANGQFLTEEFAITPRIAGSVAQPIVLTGEPSDPSLALGSDGGFLLAWKQIEKRGYRLLGQAFDAQGKAQSELLEFDAGEEAPPVFKADIDVASFADGYAVAFGHKDRGVFVRSVQAGGRGVGPAVLAGEHPLCQNVSLVELDGGSLAVAWDITVAGPGNKAVRGRVLSPQLEPISALIEPPLTLFGDDWDPAIAPVAGGGFAIAFTGGKRDNCDVFLRFFDAHGGLASPLVPISTRANEQDWPSIARLSDGSLCVGFEDDLSAYDHVYVRRVAKGVAGGPAAILGECRTLNEREAILNEARTYPRVAALAGGAFAAVWIDCRRSKSSDVRVKIVGPKFDEAGQ